MLRIKTLLVSILSFNIIFAVAQDAPDIVHEQWEKTPALHNVEAKYLKEPAVVITDKRRIEFIDVKGDQLQYRTLHKIVRLNDDRGIEAYNKIYLPVVENKLLVDIKARTILPNGKIIELNKNDIKDVKEENDVYKIFAMEGLTRGCEIEFMYTYNNNLSYFGREIMQGNHSVIGSELEIISPSRLKFETKSFNGDCQKMDTTLNDKNIVKLSIGEMAAADDEKYAMKTANLQRVEYKLSFNKARGENERLFTWNDLAKRVFEMNSSFNEKEQKKMSNVVESNRWKGLPDDKSKIVAIESYFKKNISTRDDIYSEEAENIEWILKNKISSERGMMRLFSAALTQVGIAHEFVLCGSRESFSIDKSFENWLNCNNELIYIPALQKFVSPSTPTMRFPWFDPTWAGADGIFCKPTTIGNFNTAIAYLKNIKLEAAEATSINFEADIKLNSSFDTLLVDAKNILTGYSSSTYRGIFNFNSEEDTKEIIKSMVKHAIGTEKIISTKIENKEFEDITDNKPFVMQTVVQAPNLIEKAGKRVLVKVGELIGPQAEMYQEKKRQFPIEIEYPHILARKISMEIPAGYKVKNLDEFKKSTVHKEGSDVTMGFESTVDIKGNIVTINVYEQYRKIRYSMDQYDVFKNVINAAADFNKLVLVLEKI
jgi:hypothetical protein